MRKTVTLVFVALLLVAGCAEQPKTPLIGLEGPIIDADPNTPYSAIAFEGLQDDFDRINRRFDRMEERHFQEQRNRELMRMNHNLEELNRQLRWDSYGW